MPKFEPLNDIWNNYVTAIEEATAAGRLDTVEAAEEAVFPEILHLGDGEKLDVRKYIQLRMQEIIEKIQAEKVVDPSFLAVHMFRTLICGMLWEKERIG